MVSKQSADSFRVLRRSRERFPSAPSHTLAQTHTHTGIMALWLIFSLLAITWMFIPNIVLSDNLEGALWNILILNRACDRNKNPAHY